MMTAADYRAKADEWAARAESAPEGEPKLRFEPIARSWASLAASAEAEEADVCVSAWLTIGLLSTPTRSQMLAHPAK